MLMDFIGRPAAIIPFDTVALMTAMPKPASAITVIVSGRTTKGDGGGGEFYWDAASTTTANGGTVFASDAGGTGRFIRIYSEWVNIKWFGAKGDGIVDDTTAVQAAIGASNKVSAPAGTYLISSTLLPTLTTNLFGAGPNVTIFKWGPATNLPIIKLTSASIAEATAIFKDFKLTAATNRVSSFELENVAHVLVENIFAEGLSTGLWLKDCLVSTFERFHANDCVKGIYLNADQGTSLNEFRSAKITNCTDAIYFDGTSDTSFYGNTFYSCDIEFNARALYIPRGYQPNLFVGCYFECDSTGPRYNELKVAGTGFARFITCGFGDTGATADFRYFTTDSTGQIVLDGCTSGTQGRRLAIPQIGAHDHNLYDNHASITNIKTTLVNYEQRMPVLQARSSIGASATVEGYQFGSASVEGLTVKNIVAADPALAGSWSGTAPTAATADPIGGTTAVTLNAGEAILTRAGAGATTTGWVTVQAWVKVISATSGELILYLKSSNVVQVTRIYTYSGLTDWMLISASLNTNGLGFSDSYQIGLYAGASGHIAVWQPSILSDVKTPFPVIKYDSTVTYNFTKTGLYTLRQADEPTLTCSGGAGTTVNSADLVLVSGDQIAKQIIIQENNGATSIYDIGFSYTHAATTANCINLRHSFVYNGIAARCIPTMNGTGAGAVKGITFTNSDTVTATIFIREL